MITDAPELLNQVPRWLVDCAIAAERIRVIVTQAIDADDPKFAAGVQGILLREARALIEVVQGRRRAEIPPSAKVLPLQRKSP